MVQCLFLSSWEATKPVSVATSHNKYYPLYVSIGSVHDNICQAHLGCDMGMGNTTVSWSWVTQVWVWFPNSRPKATPWPVTVVSQVFYSVVMSLFTSPIYRTCSYISWNFFWKVTLHFPPKVPTPQAQLADTLPSCHAIQFDSVSLFCLTLQYSLPSLFSSTL